MYLLFKHGYFGVSMLVYLVSLGGGTLGIDDDVCGMTDVFSTHVWLAVGVELVCDLGIVYENDRYPPEV